tara:strand:- start:8075 stop:8461 length:387 start_codon:yes stop_codon:yes gene_type:complete
MKPSTRVPPAGSTGALIAAIGLGIAIWFGWDWYHLPRWSEQEIAQSVELNLALDLSRQPEVSVSQTEQERMREAIRQDVLDAISKEAELPRGFTMAGLLMTAFGIAQMLIRSWLAKKPSPGVGSRPET